MNLESVSFTLNKDMVVFFFRYEGGRMWHGWWSRTLFDVDCYNKNYNQMI